MRSDSGAVDRDNARVTQSDGPWFCGWRNGSIGKSNGLHGRSYSDLCRNLSETCYEEDRISMKMMKSIVTTMMVVITMMMMMMMLMLYMA